MLRLLKTFQTVYEVRNFSQAAQLLFISQPTVSVQIRQLEKELGSPLFIRKGRKDVLPTQQAELLYHSSLHIIKDWDTICQQMQEVQHHTQYCMLSVSNILAAQLLPLLLKDLYQTFPTTKFTAKVTNSFEVFKGIQHKSIDLGIIEKPLSDSSIHRYELMQDQLVLAGDEQQGPWLIREADSGLYFYTKQYLDEHDIQLPTMEIHSNDIIVKLIKEGFGCSIISESLCRDLPYRSLGEKFSRSFYLLESKDLPLETEIRQISSFIRAWFDAFHS